MVRQTDIRTRHESCIGSSPVHPANAAVGVADCVRPAKFCDTVALSRPSAQGRKSRFAVRFYSCSCPPSVAKASSPIAPDNDIARNDRANSHSPNASDNAPPKPTTANKPCERSRIVKLRRILIVLTFSK